MHYGIYYHVAKPLKDCPDNLCSLIVDTEHAPKIKHIAERYGIGTLDHLATVEPELVRGPAQEQSAQSAEVEPVKMEQAEDLAHALMGRASPERTQEPPSLAKAENLANALMGKPSEQAREGNPAPNPNMATTEKPHPSAPISENNKHSADRGTLNKPSVSGALREIRANQRKQNSRVVPVREEKPREQVKPASPVHKQPRRKKKSKNKGR